MKKFFSILALLSVLSYAGLGDFLKSTGKSLTETCDKCNAEYKTLDVNSGCSSIDNDNEAKFRKCSDFVENCKCWTKAGDSERDNEYRAYKFQEFKNELSRVGPEIRERVRQDSVRNAKLREQAKQDSIKKESERLERTKRDSVKQESANEIYALISGGAEIDLILDKCNKHERTFNSLKECNSIQDSIKYQQKIIEITALLKANKLEESLEECQQIEYGSNRKCLDECMQPKFGTNDYGERILKNPSKEECLGKCGQNEKLVDLCKKQLTAKVKKLPKNKITSPALAYIYYDCEADDKCPKIIGFVFQNDGKMMLIEDLVWKGTIMVQHIGHIGECQLRPNRQIPFAGYGKYLGDKTYTTVTGARQSVQNYQLLWCGN
ncbi:hypothetical protein R83H12_03044 [Fibrobacteria bacterium R8-3-H12]